MFVPSPRKLISEFLSHFEGTTLSYRTFAMSSENQRNRLQEAGRSPARSKKPACKKQEKVKGECAQGVPKIV